MPRVVFPLIYHDILEEIPEASRTTHHKALLTLAHPRGNLDRKYGCLRIRSHLRGLRWRKRSDRQYHVRTRFEMCRPGPLTVFRSSMLPLISVLSFLLWVQVSSGIFVSPCRALCP